MMAVSAKMFFVLLSALLLPWFAAGQGCTGPSTPGELKAALVEGYDKLTRPGEALAALNGTVDPNNPPPPDEARIQLHVLALNAIDQKRNEYEVTVWFRRTWFDFRLQYASASQGGCFPDDGRVGFSEKLIAGDDREIWSPNIYIENLAKPVSKTAGSVWIYPSGRVMYVNQMEVTLACQMNFDEFPRDVQHCGMRVGTFLEDAKMVTLGFFEGQKPVTLAQDAQQSGSLPHGGTTEWRIEDARGVDIVGSGGATQEESTVEIQLELARNSEYYSDFVIIPAVMFVAIGWFSFFIGRAAAPARVAMSMIGFLANMNFLAAQLGQLPRLGNDVWLLTFLSMSSWFGFYAIAEYVICNYLRRIQGRIDGARKRTLEILEAREKSGEKRKKRKKKKNHDEVDDEDDEEMGGGIRITKNDLTEHGFNYTVDLLMMRQDTQMHFSDEHLEIFSRYAYPVIYGVGLLILWFA